MDMKTILRRKDNSSIFCPVFRKPASHGMGKTKVIEATIGFTLIVVGIFIILFTL